MKQNQIIALVAGKKSRIQKFMTGLHHGWQKERLSGISRTFAPLEDGGETFPSESRVVQLHVSDAVNSLMNELSDFITVVATQECGNTSAVADIAVGEAIIAKAVPVTVLLFLEKQLNDLRAFASNIPVLPTDREWRFDEAKNCWVTQAEETVKTQKKVEVVVKYDATKEHPAQTELISIDRTVGHWTTIHMSGALPESERNAIIGRVELLQDAVKVAREQANSIEVELRKDIGVSLLGFIFTS